MFARGGCGSPGHARSTSMGGAKPRMGCPLVRRSTRSIVRRSSSGRGRVAPASLEQREELGAAAEAEERSDALPDRGRELPHAAAARVAQRIPVPAPRGLSGRGPSRAA